MNALKQLKLKYRYRSNRDDLVNDFFVPCLSVAAQYRRAAGYFSSGAIMSLATGLKELLKNGGHIQLVASPNLSEDDIAAIKKGYDLRERITEALERELKSIPWTVGLEAMSWLIASRMCDIRIACRKTFNGCHGIYHEKMGIVYDREGDYLTFSGSINETYSALKSNFESFDVDFSWDDHKGIAKEKAMEFEFLWENKTTGVDVIDFTDALKQGFLERRRFNSREEFLDFHEEGEPKDSTDDEPEVKRVVDDNNDPPRVPAFPDGLELMPHQKQAIKAWFEKNGQGILKMATGSGKTITALASMVKLCEWIKQQGKSLLIVIVVPYQHLVQQWADASAPFNFHPVRCYRATKTWIADAQSLILMSNIGKINGGVLLATDATFRGVVFQDLLKRITSDMAFVIDECHNAGAKHFSESLPARAKFRLGLSATPERHHDDEGTESLIKYFGSIVYEYGLKEALESGTLCPYYYYPHTVDLTPDEACDYLALSKRIGIEWSINDDINENDNLQTLLIRRARICANAENKVKELFSLLEPYKKSTHLLVYCGDGNVDEEGAPLGECRQIENIVSMLGHELGMRCHMFTANENAAERKNLIDRFDSGDLQVLVAIRCLDEGFDVPSTEIAFILASSTNPRQFIQRRGRVLRKSMRTGKKCAIIHDFIIIPPKADDESEDFSSTYHVERSLFSKELTRVSEFARLAQNGLEAMQSLAKLRQHYGLTHI